MQLDAPQGQFQLRREPHQDRSPLRAWDAADEYLLHYLAESELGDSGLNTSADGPAWLIVNDGFGALSVALSGHAPTLWSDSLIAHTAAEKNLDRNGLPLDAIAMLPSVDAPTGPIGVAIVKVPRSNALLEHQLRTLRPHLVPGSIIVAGGMVKRLPASAIELFETIIGPTTTSLAKKKARLIHATFDPERNVGSSPYPTSFTTESGLRVVNHANVFARSQLDIGTRVLLDNLPTVDPGATVVDLGCGNGVVGATVARAQPDARVIYTDSSYMAVASAQATHEANGAVGDAEFRAADGLDASTGPVDLVLNNPPFHNDNVVGDAIAWQMFTQSHRALRDGGELRVVANRHLGYHTKLQRIFGNCRTVASTTKFVVLSAAR